jgi:hypothetical protein
MSENNNNYLDSISSAGIAAAAQESRRMAQELEDARVREAREKRLKRDLDAREEARKEAERLDAEKRAKLQAESDAIIQAQLDEEKARAKREYRGVMGSDEGFEAWWKDTTDERINARIAERRAQVANPRDYARGDFTGFGAQFTPMDFPR